MLSMTVFSRFTRNAVLAMLAALACGVHAYAAELAGTVSFVIGDANRLGADGQSNPLKRGDNVEAGQTLVTGDSGHVHLKMSDGAFISVRPKSRLHIVDYHIDMSNPSQTRIKFDLQEGVARSITGKGGEAARQNFRLNTPLAAIGIRGTDFVVQASDSVTRVVVQSGAVSVSPLSEQCVASALGPCDTSATRVLSAAMQNAYLELKSRSEAPRLVPAEKALESPNVINPARPEEPKAGAAVKASSATDDAVSQLAASTINSTLSGKSAAPSAPPSPTPTPVVVLPPAAKFWWGRWGDFANQGAGSEPITAVLSSDRTPLFQNEVFGLIGEAFPSSIPSTGTVKFTLGASEADFLVNHKTLVPAQVSQPSLTIDFAGRTYDTSLVVSASNYAPVQIQSSGKLTFQGVLQSLSGTADTRVLGALSPDASQVGYVFQRDLNGNLSVVGVTRWYK